ncbi:SMP-30/gluconolactonase/LRE family protein [Nocardia sp. NPDC059240]|uniref:SMP-30/gluconolactonase/LRE family protein n=1 Tax=Nocardia sp. NPDC059240 TaxID=3346786 RepID=UPI0036B3DD76
MPRRRPEAAVPQSDRRGRVAGVVALMLGSAAFAGPAAADAPETPVAPTVSCSPAKLLMGLPTRTPLLDWSENLGFDASGAIWVARNFGNVVEKYDNDNRGQVVTSVPVTSPGAVRLGPDGLMYVTFGNSPISGAAKQGGVLRFDPNAADPRPEVFVSGLGQANGAAFDADGNLYVADSVSNTIERIRRDGTLDADWTDRAGKALAALGSGTDGIVAVGDLLYVTLLESPTARVVAVPIADPAQASPAVDLAAAPLTSPLLPDDLAVGPGGFLYVATGSGQLVRADPVTHTSCTLASVEPLTSVAVSPSDNRLLLLGTENGDVLKAHVPPV